MKRILIVEDEPSVSELLEDVLSNFGYEVAGVYQRGETVLEQIADIRPDLVLMDINLEGDLDGIQTAAEIQKIIETPIIYLTAQSGDEYLHQAKNTAPYGYLTKPFRNRELHAAIETTFIRRDLENRLKKNEQWLHTTLKSIGDAVIAADLEMRVRLFNPVAEPLTGYSQSEALGKNLNELLEIRTDDAQNKRIRLPEQVGARLRFGINRAVALVNRSNERIPIDGTFSPIQDEEGKPAGAVIVFRNITERRLVESERKQHEQQLKDAVEAAEAANRAKTDFLANMSHEIRTPISGIIGILDMILGYDLTEELRTNIQMIRTAAGSLQGIINDILDFSKIEAHMLELVPVDFNLRAVLEKELDPFRISAREKGLELNLSISDQVSETVGGDPDRLGQIVRNLVSNAVKFTETGKIQINVKPADAHLIEIEVRDTGIGIPREKQPLLFRGFSQLDSTYAKRFGGTGLGLAITKRLVEMMGGTITVESDAGKGATFRFTVDLRHAGKAAPPISAGTGAPPSEEATDNAAKRILVAEDNPLNRKFISHFLKKSGHDITLVSNGKEVLTALEKDCFDLILMDVQMPEMDGVETTKRIRGAATDAFDPSIPIIALTAYAMKGDKERLMAAGMDDYVSKPVNMNELSSVIDRVFRSDHCRGTDPPPPEASSENKEYIEELQGFMDAYPEEQGFWKVMFQGFISEAPVRLRKLKESLTAQNESASRRTVNALADLAEALQIHSLEKKLKPVAGAVESGDFSAAVRHFETIEGEVEAIASYLKTLEKDL